MTDQQRAGLAIADPAMSPESKRVLDRALEREAWLDRIGLRGIVTGIAGNDLNEFGKACDRLVEYFKRARAEGRRDAELELGQVWRWWCLAAAVAGFLAALALDRALGG